MQIAIRHATTYEYETAVERCTLRLKLFPPSFASQRVGRWSVAVNGETLTPLLSTPSGEGQALWSTDAPAERLEVTAEGVVETENAAGLVRGLKESARPGVFLRATSLTQADERIEAMAAEARALDGIERMHRLSAEVARAVRYTPGATDAATTAAEAVRRGAGVCQDHAHVFIAAARKLGVPARYVVGYLMDEAGALASTHGWAEAHIPSLGWVGFDPANGLCPTERYVRLCAGLDADDAAPLRGSHSGGGRESLAARVDITQAQQ